jgi:FixJ family two-component response regulator
MDTVGNSKSGYDTIYIVDPDEKHSARVSSLLTRRGYRTLRFFSAEDFLGSVKENAAGCIVSEIDLPGIDGLELLHKLQNREIELPVIFITGNENMSTAVEACRMRVADYLVKPFIAKTLVDRLRNILDEPVAEKY